MSALDAIRAGFTRVLRHPFLFAGLWLVNVLIAAPAALWMSASLSDSIGKSRVHERLRSGFDMDWYGEYKAAADGIERSFDPTVAGAGAVLDNLQGWLTGDLFRGGLTLIVLGVIYALVWALLLGGVVARYAQTGSGRGPRAFIRDGGGFFFRFVRLAALSGGLYVLIYLFSDYLFERIDEMLRDVTAETTALTYSLFAWAATAFLLVLVHMIFDYAKIATVIEARRSMLFAALRAAGFVLLNPLRTLGLYAGILFVGALVVALYSIVAPGVTQSTPLTVVLAFAAGQIFLVARLGLRLSLLAAQTELFRTQVQSNSSEKPAVSR